MDDLTGAGIASAWVSALGEDGDTLFSSFTNDEGAFFVPGFQDVNRIRLVVEALGFRSNVGGPIQLESGGLFVTVRLDPQPTTGEGLVVEVDQRSAALVRSGFYARRESRPGVFIDPEILSTHVAPTLGDVLRRSAGVGVTPSGEPFSARTMGTGFNQQTGCLPSVVVDNQVVRVGGQRVPDGRFSMALEFVAPPATDVAAMEFYHSATAPPEYGGLGAGCGVIVIWTKR